MTFISMHYDYKGPHPNRYKPHKRIGLAKVKRGRLISLEAGFDSGYVHTRPFYFEGSKLFLNANAQYGLITIRLYDENGKSIPNGAATIIGRDEVDIPVGFANLNLAELKGKPVKMKITLENAQLYGFRVE
jgi:hypothetical protein